LVGAGGAAMALVSKVIWGCVAVVVAAASVDVEVELEATELSEEEDVEDALVVGSGPKVAGVRVELDSAVLEASASVVVCSGASVG